MRRLTSRVLFLAAILGLAGAPASDAFAKGGRRAKAARVKKAKKKRVPPVSAAHKKKLAEQLFHGFKFGMTKDQVVAQLAKAIEEQYEERIKATTDVTTQDRLRRDRKRAIARIKATYVSFEGKRTGWDVSIIEGEFAHKTGESMLEKWEKDGAKNNRRFFFFKDGELYKMFVQLDVSVLPEDKKNFETFAAVMQSQFGPGDIQGDTITWRTDEFHARAVNKLRTYDALALVIENPRVVKELVALREAMAPPKKGTSAIIKAVIDKDEEGPNVDANSDAIDAVIRASGGSK